MFNQTMQTGRQKSLKQVNWQNKYAFNSIGKIKVSAVTVIDSNLTRLLALSAILAHNIISLCFKHCGRIKALHLQDDM